MQMSPAMKWSAMLITFLLFGNDFSWFDALDSSVLTQAYLINSEKKIVEYDVKSDYPEEYSTVDKVGRDKL